MTVGGTRRTGTHADAVGAIRRAIADTEPDGRAALREALAAELADHAEEADQ